MNKLKIFKEKLLKDPKLSLIILLVLATAAFVVLLPNFKQVSFTIEDKCGRFINVMSHTIEDESACRTRCKSQCESSNYGYRKSDFAKSGSACNSCICYCK